MERRTRYTVQEKRINLIRLGVPDELFSVPAKLRGKP